MRVLDLGCGNGCYTAELARRAAYVCGVDLQMPHLKAFRQAIPRLQAAAEDLPFASESFDAVTMIEVLEHTDRDSQVLKECFRVLKPGGFLVLLSRTIVSVRKPSLSHRRLLPWPQHSVDLVASGLNPQTSLRRSSLFAPQTHFDSPPSRISEPGDGLHVSSFGFPPAAMERKPIDALRFVARKVCLGPVWGFDLRGLPKARPARQKLAIGTSVIPSPARFLRNHRGTGPCGSDTRGGGQNGAMDRERRGVHSIAATSMHGWLRRNTIPNSEGF